MITRYGLCQLAMLPAVLFLCSCGGGGGGGGQQCSSGFHGVETTGPGGLPLASCALDASKQVTWSGTWSDAGSNMNGTLTLNLSNESGTITFADTSQTVALAVPLPQGGGLVNSGSTSNEPPSIGFQYTYHNQTYVVGGTFMFGRNNHLQSVNVDMGTGLNLSTSTTQLTSFSFDLAPQ